MYGSTGNFIEVMNLLIVFGTRPEAIKLAPLILKLRKQFRVKICVTGQHKEMLEQVLKVFQIDINSDLRLMKPNQNLATLTSGVLQGVHDILGNERFDWVIVQGDTTSSMSGLVMSCTVIGYGHKKQISYRDKAKVDDIICVSGDLGRAFLGLLILQREKSKYLDEPKNQPDLSKYKKLVEKQLRPEARKDIIDYFKSYKIVPNSMIDISDGLSSDLLHISNSSDLGFKIFEEKLPIELDTYSVSRELNIDYLEAVLNGGDNLFFTTRTLVLFPTLSSPFLIVAILRTSNLTDE